MIVARTMWYSTLFVSNIPSLISYSCSGPHYLKWNATHWSWINHLLLYIHYGQYFLLTLSRQWPVVLDRDHKCWWWRIHTLYGEWWKMAPKSYGQEFHIWSFKPGFQGVLSERLERYNHCWHRISHVTSHREPFCGQHNIRWTFILESNKQW